MRLKYEPASEPLHISVKWLPQTGRHVLDLRRAESMPLSLSLTRRARNLLSLAYLSRLSRSTHDVQLLSTTFMVKVIVKPLSTTRAKAHTRKSALQTLRLTEAHPLSLPYFLTFMAPMTSHWLQRVPSPQIQPLSTTPGSLHSKPQARLSHRRVAKGEQLKGFIFVY